MTPQTQSNLSAATTAVDDPLFDQVVNATKPENAKERERAKASFDEFLKQAVSAGPVVSADVDRQIAYWISQIDEKLSMQVNEVMHHASFQKLEGTWRGLRYLVMESETGENLKIKVLNVKKDELLVNFEKAVEFDQSVIFKKIYEEEYGQFGGHPYGMMVGDYEFGRSAEDVSLLTYMSQVAAAAHAPFIAGPSPTMFRMDRFSQLGEPRDLAKIFDSVDYAKWKSFRESPDSRYVALAMPRVLARLPYGREGKKVREFNFEETVDGKDHDKYLWMSAAWAYASRVTSAFSKDGWFARTRGVEGGGKVENLPVHTFPTDDGGVAMKCPTEIAITDRREKELSDLGFLPLIHCKNRDFAAFMGAQSCQKPQEYYDPKATANAALSAKIHYMLCVSRFAHYLKVMVRDKIGSFMERDEAERWLNEWINNYVIANPEGAGDEMKARHPLRQAQVAVQEVPGKPGYYQAVAHLRPHFQLEGLDVSLRLVAEMPKKIG